MTAFIVAVLVTSTYVAAYVSLGEYTNYRGNTVEGKPVNCIVRYYRDREWARTVFRPAALV
jgi:hypothetical protein